MLLALAGLAGAGGCGVPAGDRGASIEVGGVEAVDAVLARHRGRGVLLNFWAIWCAPCVAELPALLEVGREFRDQGGDVVLVSYDLMVPGPTAEEARAEVAAFASARGIDAPIVIYDAPDYEAINARFDLAGGVPMTLALDRDGAVVDRHDGEAGRERFAEMMRAALR